MQVPAKQGQLIIAERARSERHSVRLLDHGLQDPRMAVPLVHSGIRSQAVEIALAVNVVHPHAFRPLDDDVERTVVVGAIIAFEVYEFLAERSFHYGHDFTPSPEASLGLPSAHTGRSQPGGSKGLAGRHPQFYPTPPCEEAGA